LSAAIREDLAVHLGAFVVEHPEARSAAEVVEAARSAGPIGLLRWTFGDLIASTPGIGPVVDRALEGDAAAAAEIRGRAGAGMHGADKHAKRLALLADSAEIHAAAMGLLEGWLAQFGEIEPRVAAILDRDYGLRAGDRATLSGSDLIERTT